MCGVKGQRARRGQRFRNAKIRARAAAAGALTYDTGQQCVRGHRCGRYVSTGACVECQAMFARGYWFVRRRKRSEDTENRAFAEIASVLGMA